MTTQTKSSRWGWSVSKEEIGEQVEKYHALKITESYRGVSVLILSALLLLSLILSFSGVYVSLTEMLWGLIIYIPLLIFAYRGHRWAIIALIILWTFEKGVTLYQSVQNDGSPIGSIIWWLIVTPHLVKALKVENERKRQMSKDTIFCVKCGANQSKDGKFCTKCGAGLIAHQN